MLLVQWLQLMNTDSDPEVTWNTESESQSSEFSSTSYSSNLDDGWSNIYLERRHKFSVINFVTYRSWITRYYLSSSWRKHLLVQAVVKPSHQSTNKIPSMPSLSDWSTSMIVSSELQLNKVTSNSGMTTKNMIPIKFLVVSPTSRFQLGLIIVKTVVYDKDQFSVENTLRLWYRLERFEKESTNLGLKVSLKIVRSRSMASFISVWGRLLVQRATTVSACANLDSLTHSDVV